MFRAGHAFPKLLCSVFAAGASAVHTLHAQQPPVNPPRPAFEGLRFREDWSNKTTGDAFDPIKHIALNAAGGVWLSLGGHVRVRGERDRNFMGGGAGDRDDSFTLARAHVHADLHLGSSVRFFLEGRESYANGRALPGGIRVSDRNDLDFGNAFAEYVFSTPGQRISARVGRQEFLLGRERIVSPLDWANVRRVFEGAALDVRRGALSIGAFATHPLVVNRTHVDAPDHRTTFWGSNATWQQAKSPRIVEGALLIKSTAARGVDPFAERASAIGRVVTPLMVRGVLLEVEGGLQQVRSGGNTSVASMLATDLTWSRTTAWSPSIGVGVDRASGTGAGDVAQSGTWDQLYPLAHAYAGYADVLGRRNLMEERLVAQISPRPTVRIRISAHAFQRASSFDAAYDPSGGILRAAGTSASDWIGTEGDATVQWRIGRHVRLDGGGARFAPGQFMRDTGAARPYSWLFGSMTTTF